MALRKTLSLTNNFGDQSQIDCYIRVVEISCSKTQCVAKFNLLRNGTDKVLEKRDHLFEMNVTPEAKNIWEQAYTSLKLVTEFAGAQDC
jgi:hypothetical protein